MRACLRTVAILLATILISSCRTLPGPREVTPDGLERVPSRAAGGVFRAPGAPFTQYRRLIVEPLTVAFAKGWDEQHEDVSAAEIKRMREEAARNFREEFVKVLIDEGPYTFADDPGADVLIVAPSVVDLDVPGPESDHADKQIYAPRSLSLQLTGELRDAATGKLVGRIITFSGGEEYGVGGSSLRPTNRTTNAHEMRLAFAKWNRMLREALDVAKVERPH